MVCGFLSVEPLNVFLRERSDAGSRRWSSSNAVSVPVIVFRREAVLKEGSSGGGGGVSDTEYDRLPGFLTTRLDGGGG